MNVLSGFRSGHAADEAEKNTTTCYGCNKNYRDKEMIPAHNLYEFEEGGEFCPSCVNLLGTQAFAAELVRRWNAHDALVAALEETTRFLMARASRNQNERDLVASARVALDAAKETK